MKNMKKDFLGKYVKFRVGRKTHYGRVLHIIHGVAHIKGIEEPQHGMGGYNYPVNEIRECTHDEVYKIGRGYLQLFRK